MSGEQGAGPRSQSGAGAAGEQWMPLPQVMALAEQHRRAGRLAAAEDLCRQLLRAHPSHAEAVHLLGIIAHQAGNAAAAIELVRRAIALDGAVALYHSNLGEMCRLAGRPQEAVEAGKRAVALNPESPQAWSNLGIAHYDRDTYDEAVACQERAIALAPGFAEAHSNLGNALRAKRRYEGAIASYRRALDLKPNYAEAYNNLGTVLRDLKRVEEAEAIYRKALSLNPNDTEALNNLALALKDLDRLDEAVAVLTKSSAINPRNDKTYTYLGCVLLDQDKVEEAATAAERALALRPESPDAVNLMGRVAFQRGNGRQALDLYHRALALKPDLADAHNNIGNALKEVGRLAEAREAYRKALELDPRMTGVYVNLADTIKFKPGDPLVAEIESLAKDMDSWSKTEQTQLHFTLAKIYDDLGDHPRAFEHMRGGCALKRQQIKYDEATVLGLFDTIEATYTAELLRAKEGHGHPSAAPIFILGMPRSGTTLVEQILASHPAVFGGGELKVVSELVDRVHGPDGSPLPYPGFVPALEPAHLGRFGERYVARIRALAPEAERITDKMPSNYYFVGLIHLALPNAHIIHTRRDPVDTCFSCFSKLFSAPQLHTYDLGELGRYYRKYAALMAHWQRVLPEGRMLEVQYEDIVGDLDTQARRIVAYCGLEWNDSCLSFYKTDRPVRTASAMQVRQPIYKSAMGRWRQYKEFLGPLLKELEIE